MYRAARKSDALLTGAPLPTLFYFALPIILGNIFQQLYSIVDAIVVGKFLGDLPLAGISVAAPIVDVANALVIGGTIGIGVLCAQMCGAEDWMRLRRMNATALLGGAALTLKRSELRFERRMGGMVLSYAWAAALQQAVVCIGRLLVQGMLTPLGTNTVTGYNMSLRIEQFLFCFSQGVSAAMVVCLSQNLGHGDRVRVRRFYRVSVCVEAALIAVLGTVCFLFPSQIVGLFSDNGEVIAAGARYTGTMAYLYLFAYMGEVIQGFFRGLGRLRLTMLASLLQVVLRVVLSYFLIPVWGMYGICVAVASGWVLLVLIEGSYSVRTAQALTMEKRED